MFVPRAGPGLVLLTALSWSSTVEETVMARLVMVTGILALIAVLLAGCGAGDDHAKVEASLQHYLGNLTPEDAPFPAGAGIPRVKDNGCEDRDVKTEKGQVLSSRNLTVRMGEGLALWSCVVRFGTLAMPVLVAVDDSTDVVWATPGEFEQFKLK
jgi:hypothetical protein